MTFGSLLSTAAPLVSARSLTATEAPGQFAPCGKILYAGLVGAMETSRHKGSGVVQLRDILRGRGYTDVCAESFSPFSWESCRDCILSQFPMRPGPLTETASVDSSLFWRHIRASNRAVIDQQTNLLL